MNRTLLSIAAVTMGFALVAGCDRSKDAKAEEVREVDPRPAEPSEPESETKPAAEETMKQAEPAQPADLGAPPDVAAPPADAEKTASGLASKVLSAGSGTAHPEATSNVQVHYSGWTTDGKMFDSSVKRGQPATFPLNRVIAGWTEGLQLMVEGEKRRLWIPEELAYKGSPGRPQGMLVFDVELIKILD